MAENQKDIIYKCPCCFNRFIDVPIDKDGDGIYRCMKCGFNGTLGDMLELYANFKKRYRLMATRLTLEEQRRR